MHKIIILSIATFLSAASFGQSAKEQLNIINSVTLNTTDFFEEIPFHNKFGYFIIPVNIGDAIYDYIFDTGGYNTITSEIMNSNKLPSLMEVNVGSSNQLKSTIALTKVPSVTIGNIDFKDIGALNFDFDQSPQITCYTNGGLIGKSVINKAVWQINSKDQKMILTDDISKLNHLDNAIKIKVSFDKTLNPFIKAKLNGKTKTFMLDFGYGGFISLTEKDGKKLSSNNTVEIEGEGSVSANGIVNESMFAKDLERFEIGKFNIPNQAAYYIKSNNYNLIGAGITKHFIVTLNFKDSELLLTPIHNEDAIKPTTTFGFDLNRNEDGIYVSKLYKGLSAEKEGLQLNDIVISINNKTFKDKPYCDFYDYANACLKADAAIQLTVLRDGKSVQLTIARKQLF